MIIKTNAVQRLTAHKLGHVFGDERGDHEAAGALIFAADTGNLLLQHRDKTSMEPLTWGQFGGSLEGTETREQGLKREIWEETGYRGPMKLIFIMDSGNPADDFHYYNYIAIVPHQFVPKTNEESAGYKWFNPKMQWPQPLHPGMKKMLANPKAKQLLAQHMGVKLK